MTICGNFRSEKNVREILYVTYGDDEIFPFCDKVMVIVTSAFRQNSGYY